MSVEQEKNPIILFDGVCNFCESSVQFIIKKDKKNIFKFASLQSEFARLNLPQYGVDPNIISSVLLIKNGKVYDKSSAALKIASSLNGLYPLMMIFWIVPKFIRDAVYNIIAKNRYKWFGKKSECWLPSPEIRAKFLGS